MSGEEPSIQDLFKQLKQVRIQEARIIEQIERKSAKDERAKQAERARASTFNNSDHLPIDYQIGDRVRITNNVRDDQTKTATITKVNPIQIGIVTDDGSHTWRVRKNLEKL